MWNKAHEICDVWSNDMPESMSTVKPNGKRDYHFPSPYDKENSHVDTKIVGMSKNDDFTKALDDWQLQTLAENKNFDGNCRGNASKNELIADWEEDRKTKEEKGRKVLPSAFVLDTTTGEGDY